ncbi:MAG TPA: phytanoyl-CoA dioxygenase family protein [Candidatus Binataceae bacterium]|nr:phytanoyl-CoA dioxygenase family protein [Candidatus Binataceae bacterium]
MRVPDGNLAQVWDRGFTIVENFLDPETLAAAQEALWEIYPNPEDYFRAPEEHPELSRGQFAGLRLFPYGSWALNRLAVHPDLVDSAERLLGTRELEIYKIELWAKYSGAINYDQPHHRDFGNHSLVVPRADRQHTQMTTFILLSDVTAQDAPTKLVPLEFTRELPLSKRLTSFGRLFDHEVAATASAGSLLIYKTDVFHRGSDFTGVNRSRFMMLVDFQQRGWRWQGKMSWPDRADMPGMSEAIVRMTPRERDLFGWPPPGSEYWNEQTIADVAARYPAMDMTPYLKRSPD